MLLVRLLHRAVFAANCVQITYFPESARQQVAHAGNFHAAPNLPPGSAMVAGTHRNSGDAPSLPTWLFRGRSRPSEGRYPLRFGLLRIPSFRFTTYQIACAKNHASVWSARAMWKFVTASGSSATSKGDFFTTLVAAEAAVTRVSTRFLLLFRADTAATPTNARLPRPEPKFARSILDG
jgi:hypothetical protein